MCVSFCVAPSNQSSSSHVDQGAFEQTASPAAGRLRRGRSRCCHGDGPRLCCQNTKQTRHPTCVWIIGITAPSCSFYIVNNMLTFVIKSKSILAHYMPTIGRRVVFLMDFDVHVWQEVCVRCVRLIVWMQHQQQFANKYFLCFKAWYILFLCAIDVTLYPKTSAWGQSSLWVTCSPVTH